MRHSCLWLLLLATQLAAFSSGVQSQPNVAAKRGPVKTPKPAEWCDRLVPGCSECYEEHVHPAAGVPHTKPGDHVTVLRCTACAAPLYKFNAKSESCDCAHGAGSAYRNRTLLEARLQPGSGNGLDAKDPTSSLGDTHGPADGTDIWEMQTASAAEASEDAMMAKFAAENANDAAGGDRTHDDATNGGNPGAHGHRVRQSHQQRAKQHKENRASAQSHRAAASEHNHAAAAAAAADGSELDSVSTKTHGHGHAVRAHVRLHGKNKGGQQEDFSGDSAAELQDAETSGPKAHLARRAHKHLDAQASDASSSDKDGGWFNNKNKAPEEIWDSEDNKHDNEHKHLHPKPHSHRSRRDRKAEDADTSGDDWNRDWSSNSGKKGRNNKTDRSKGADRNKGSDSSKGAEEQTVIWAITPKEQLVCRACPKHLVSAGGVIGATFCSPCPEGYVLDEMQETCKSAKRLPSNRDTPRKPAVDNNSDDSDSSVAEDDDDTPGSSGKQGSKGQDSTSSKDKKARRGVDSSNEEPQRQLPGSHSKAPSSKHSKSNTKQGMGEGRSPKRQNSQPQDESDEGDDDSETTSAEDQGRKGSGSGDQTKRMKQNVLGGNKGASSGSGSHRDTAAVRPEKRYKQSSGSRRDDTDDAAEAEEGEEEAAEKIWKSKHDASERDADTETDSEHHDRRSSSAKRSGPDSNAPITKRTSNSRGQNDADNSRSAASRHDDAYGAADRYRREDTDDA